MSTTTPNFPADAPKTELQEVIGAAREVSWLETGSLGSQAWGPPDFETHFPKVADAHRRLAKALEEYDQSVVHRRPGAE